MKRGLSSGFTLVELLVVIAIIGLLATFAVSQLSGARDKARVAKGQAQSSQILRSVGDDLVARWDFDECSGAIVDSSGYGNNGALVSGVTFTDNTPTNQGCSLTFNGTNSVAIPISTPISAQQTKTMWAYITAPVSGNQYLLDEGAGNNNCISVYNYHVRTITNASYILDSNTTVTTNKWYFIATSFDGTKLNLYIDGTLDKSISTTGQTPASPVTLGNFGGGGAYRLTGSLNDVRIYNRALTSSEIHRLYAEGLPRHVATR